MFSNEFRYATVLAALPTPITGGMTYSMSQLSNNERERILCLRSCRNHAILRILQNSEETKNVILVQPVPDVLDFTWQRSELDSEPGESVKKEPHRSLSPI